MSKADRLLAHIQTTRPDVTTIDGPLSDGSFAFDPTLPDQAGISAIISQYDDTAGAISATIQDTIRKAIAFGNSLTVSFAAENVLLGITQQGKTGEVLSKLTDVMAAVSAGSLYEAITRIKAVPSGDYDATFITGPRLLSFINKIETYLGLPLSTEL